MPMYADLGGNSGVIAYEEGPGACGSQSGDVRHSDRPTWLRYRIARRSRGHRSVSRRIGLRSASPALPPRAMCATRSACAVALSSFAIVDE